VISTSKNCAAILRATFESELRDLVTGGSEDSKPTAGFQRVIERAVIYVQCSGREEVTGANVLVAIFAERESHAAYLLQEQEMTRYDAVNFISHGIAKRSGMTESRPTFVEAPLLQFIADEHRPEHLQDSPCASRTWSGQRRARRHANVGATEARKPNQLKDRDRRAVRAPLRRRRTRSKSGK
jgi:ATP-dependent Clp protease ATP-binding subunit ClpA